MSQKTILEYSSNAILPHEEINRKRMENIKRAVEEGLGISWEQWQKMVKNERLWKKVRK